MREPTDKNKVFIVIGILCIAAALVACVGVFFTIKDTNDKLVQNIASLESELNRLEKEIKDQEDQTRSQESAAKEQGNQETEDIKEESRKPDIIENTLDQRRKKEGGFTEPEETEETEWNTKRQNAGTETHVVAIDPGHQGREVDMSEEEANAPGSSVMKTKSATGTQGIFSGVPEYQLNLDISLALQAELENRGYRVIMTRTDNETAISNAKRAIKAYEEGGEIYVRIHANGADDSSVGGALTMTSTPDNPNVGHLYGESCRLATCILDAYCEATGFGNEGNQEHDDMTGINWSKIPVMILEMGYMTNEDDDLAMTDPSFQPRMVEGIANGIDRYFEGQSR